MPRKTTLSSTRREAEPTKTVKTDAEKETVIRFDRSSDIAVIWTADKAIARDLKKKAKVIEETNFGTKFEISKRCISITAPKRISKTI